MTLPFPARERRSLPVRELSDARAATVNASPRRQRGREPWSERSIRLAHDDRRPARLALADPPYPHQAERHYGDHQDFAGEVDHAALIERLTAEYDGWALCTGAYMACDVMRLCPRGTRQLIWRKPSASFKPGVSISFQYEPVFVYGGRRRHRHAMILPDVFDAPVVYGEHNGVRRGVKSQPFCNHVFEALGARPDLGDTLEDVFPGSGAVTAAWESWRSTPRLPIFEPEAAA